jgi:hypothetical protein
MKKLYSVEREYPVVVSKLWGAWMNADAELPAEQAEGAKAGMESYFDNLGIYLSK